jgi:hypothetical protein
MVWKNSEVDYEAELESIRATYLQLTLKQRLGIIEQRLTRKDSGPNNLVNAVSAIEGFARILICQMKAPSLGGLEAAYKKYRNGKPLDMIRAILEEHGHDDPKAYFGEDTWELLDYAVQFRHMITHECTYLGQDKSPSMMEACGEVMVALAKFAKLDATGLVSDAFRIQSEQ